MVKMKYIHCFSENLIEKEFYAKMSYSPFIVSSAIMLRIYRLSLKEVADVIKKY